MAGMQGGDYITFKKPYLNLIEQVILNGEKLKFTDGQTQKINKTSAVNEFLTAIKSQREAEIARILKPATNYAPLFNGYRWSEIEKSQFTTGGGASDGETTRKQERASLFAIQKSIENNGYDDQKQFFKLYRQDLLKEYPEMDEEWENGIFQQQLTTQREVGNTKYRHYSRDGGFMDYISERCSRLYGIVKKDTWNPADIWLVSDLEKVKKELDRKILDNTTSLAEFNAILRDMFHSRKVVGISLKKISGKTAKWELVNLENADVFDGDMYTFSWKSAENKLSIRGNDFTVTDSKINIGSSSQEIKFQIRQNSAGFNNLKIEGTDIGASAARLGKVPLEMGSQALTGSGVEGRRWRNWRNYPTSASDFIAEKNVHIARYKSLASTGKVNLDCKSVAEFEKNMITVFDKGKKDIANSKLIQLDLLNEIFSIRQEKKLNNLLTDLGFLAQKKGTLFGPFAKLY